MARRPTCRVQITPVQPEINSDLEILARLSVNQLKVPESVKQISHELFRYDDPVDRSLMKKYAEKEMEAYVKFLHRYKELYSQPKQLDNNRPKDSTEIIRIIFNKGRRVDLEKLNKFDRILHEAADLHPRRIQNPFNDHQLKLDHVVRDPLANHTFQKTFKAKRDYYYGLDIIVPIKHQARKFVDEDDRNVIPHVLQGEIAGLDQKFKVCLDTAAPNKSIRLICRLEDDTLPCVPPIYLDIPENYPFCSPKCIIMQHDYSTPFLTSVLKILADYSFKMPKCYSVTQLLSTWELAVRKVSYPDNLHVNSLSMIYDINCQLSLN